MSPGGKRSTRPPSRNWLDRNWPTIVRVTGWFGVLFQTVFWALTNRLAPELLALFGTFVGVGEGVAALRSLAESRSGPEGEA